MARTVGRKARMPKNIVEKAAERSLTDLMEFNSEYGEIDSTNQDIVKETAAILQDNKKLISYQAKLRSNTNLSTNQRCFLLAYCVSGVVSNAAAAANVTPSAHKEWLKSSPIYMEQFLESDAIAQDHLENLAFELASGVHMKPIVSMGRIVTYEKIFDTKLLLALLKARMPAKFAQRVDITSDGHSIVKLIDKAAFDAV